MHHLKVILTSFFITCFIHSYSQIGVRVGTGSSRTVNDWSSTGALSGLSFSVFYNQDILKKKAGIRPELMYINKGYHFTSGPRTTTFHYYESRVRINYMQIPVNFVLRPFPGAFRIIEMYAGPFFAIGVNGHHEGEETANYPLNEIYGDFMPVSGDVVFKDFEASDDWNAGLRVFNKFDAGISWGFGVRYRQFLFDATFMRSLKTIYPPDEDDQDYAYNSAFQLSAAFMFKFKDFE